MWAVESGSVSPSIERDVTYYVMAKEFGFTPEVVDRMNTERVKSLMFINSKIKEKQNRESEKK